LLTAPHGRTAPASALLLLFMAENLLCHTNCLSLEDITEGELESDESDVHKAKALNARAEHLQAAATKIVENLEAAKDKNKVEYKRRRLENVTTGAKAPAVQNKVATASDSASGTAGEPRPSAKEGGSIDDVVRKVLAWQASGGPGSSSDPLEALRSIISGAGTSPGMPAVQENPGQPETPKRGRRRKAKAISGEQDDPLASLPDLPDNALVWIRVKSGHKLLRDVEGPYFFKMYSTTGKHAQVQDAQGRTFPVEVERIAFDKNAESGSQQRTALPGCAPKEQ
jgi:hypothetical protein